MVSKKPEAKFVDIHPKYEWMPFDKAKGLEGFGVMLDKEYDGIGGSEFAIRQELKLRVSTSPEKETILNWTKIGNDTYQIGTASGCEYPLEAYSINNVDLSRYKHAERISFDLGLKYSKKVSLEIILGH